MCREKARLSSSASMVWCIAILAASALWEVRADAANYYVHCYYGSNSPGQGTGTSTNAFQTITYALSQVPSGTHIIWVESGFFNERVVVDSRTNLSIRAYSGRPIIDGTGISVGGPGTEGGLVHIKNSNNVDFQGFEVRDSECAGITVETTSQLASWNIQILNNVVKNTKESGTVSAPRIIARTT